MRLGGPVFEKYTDPDSWVQALWRLGYQAAYCPVSTGASDETVAAYAAAAEAADIVIAEVGAWSNPMSSDEKTRREAIERCKKSLALAEAIAARCCVNIAGSRGSKWDGPHADDMTEATFDLIVQTVREIIDAVQPTRTFYTLETMPWMYPDSPDCYLRLMKAIDRKQFAVHLDPANLINSPQRFFRSGDLIRECFVKLGPHVRSCHAKDIALREQMTTHLDEVRPGLGRMDYRAFIEEADKLSPDTPLMLEHLQTPEEYAQAAAYVRSVEAGLIAPE
jgi:sugar phosphate isomerase/epimerase